MSRDVDEDVIEATIRRVAASKAAGRAQQAADEAEPEPTTASSQLIESTIRRVAASKAAGIAQEASDESVVDPPADESDPIEATILRVAAAAASRSQDAAVDSTERPSGVPDLHIVPPSDPDGSEPVPTPERPPVDESLIEVTLRRIEAEQAALKNTEASEPAPVVPQQPPARYATAGPAIDSWAQPTPREPVATPPRDVPLGGRGWTEAAHSLRRDLDEAQRQLHALTERVEALFGQESALQKPQTRVPALPTKPQTADDEWDDSPQLPRIPLGSPPRPAIMRDPSPHAATAAQLEYEAPEPVAPTPPTPLPAPASAVEVEARAPSPVTTKRGFDLLPRTYRITVEDKRRGVDLVPLHRALLGMDGVRDMSLLSYSNGTAIVALETTNELNPDALGKAVAHAMAREVKVEVHNEQTMVIKLAED